MQLGTTMIYVTHDQVEAMTMGDRITVMKLGVIHQVDTPLALYNTPADLFVAGFIGNPAMNVLPLALSASDPLAAICGETTLRLPEEHRARLAPWAGKSVVLGIRPECVRLDAAACALPLALSVRHEVSELLGNEVYLYLKAGASPLTARVTAMQPLGLGEALTVQLDMAQAHYFDAVSEKRI
jgi:multiple sugar transport system ATP-binding protein